MSTTQYDLLVYCPLPYNGKGPAESCVNILQNFPSNDFQKFLITPRATCRIDSSIVLTQAIPFPLCYLPWRMIAAKATPYLEQEFWKCIQSAKEKKNTGLIAHFFPSPSLSLLRRLRAENCLIIREMINSFRGTAKAILDEAYDRVGLKPNHGITETSIEEERKELELYDFVFAANSLVESSLLEAGVDSRRIISTAFGWSPARFPRRGLKSPSSEFTALFVGSICVRKGVLDLLSAWKRSNVKGKLLLVGKIEEVIRPLLQPYVADSSIVFLDYTQSIEVFYRSADIFVFPTLEEGGPQVTYEAAGCGLPVITTPMGAGRIIKHGMNGLIVRAHDVESLADAIKLLATSTDAREHMAKQAALDAQQFTYEKIGEERAEQIKTLVDQRYFRK